MDDTVFLKIKPGGLRDTNLNQSVSLVRQSANDTRISGTDRLILVGPGTGVAPMRSIIQQHCSNSSTSSTAAAAGSSVPRILLLFGCRKKARDYLYGSEWDELNNDPDGDVKVITAFSQDQVNKDYVTHAIDRNSGLIAQMIAEVSEHFGISKSCDLYVYRVVVFLWLDQQNECLLM